LTPWLDSIEMAKLDKKDGRILLWLASILDCLHTLDIYFRCIEAENYPHIISESDRFSRKTDFDEVDTNRPFPTIPELGFLKQKLISLFIIEFYRIYTSGKGAENISKNSEGVIQKTIIEMERFAEERSIDMDRLKSIKNSVKNIRDNFIAHQNGKAYELNEVEEGHLVYNQAPSLSIDDILFLRRYLLICKEFCYEQFSY